LFHNSVELPPYRASPVRAIRNTEIEEERRRGDQAVDAVEDPAVTGQEVAGVLDRESR
jgi:hypothetical protein